MLTPVSGITGSGTTGLLSKWTSSTALGNATAGTDYLAPDGNGSALTGLTGGQISGNIAGNAANVTGVVSLANGGTNADLAGATVYGDFVRVAPDGDSFWTIPLDASDYPIFTSMLRGAAPATGTPSGKFLRDDASWQSVSGGSGTVTTVSVASANGFAGTVANATTTPAITLSTSITGILKGNGTALSAATAGTDYVVGSGLAGGQTVNGGTAASENLTLVSTAHATKGNVYLGSTSTYVDNTATLNITGSGASLVIQDRVAANGNNTLYSSSGALHFLSEGGSDILTLLRDLTFGRHWVGINTAAPLAILHATSNNAANPILYTDGIASQTGPQYTMRQTSSTAAKRDCGIIDAVWATSTDASRKGRMILYAADSTGTNREGVRVESDGSQPLLGFYGAAAVAKPAVTGTREASPALASLLTQLASEGLITDSSTAGSSTAARTFGVSGTPALNATTPPIFLDRAYTCDGAVAACDTAPVTSAATLVLQTSTDGTTYSTLATVTINAAAFSGTVACTTAISANTYVRLKFTAVNSMANATATIFLKG